ncbi:MAG: PadR family transcriptional regulator [Clostridium sp.]|nr:PadR family transcriptional regulator [Clostridium sp.]
MISSDVIRGYNDTIILSILLDGPSYGYEISKTIRTITEDIYIIKETTLYSAFNRLEKNGFITSFSGTETFGKKRTYYKITSEGVNYYKDKCKEWDVTKNVINKFIKGVDCDGNN